MSDKTAGLDCWAIVELFGHQKIAGKVTEQTIAGAAMLRVDVPALDGESAAQQAFTRFFGHGAIYSINPTTEEIARGMAARVCAVPVNRYELPQPKELTAGDGSHRDGEDEHDDTDY